MIRILVTTILITTLLGALIITALAANHVSDGAGYTLGVLIGADLVLSAGYAGALAVAADRRHDTA